MKNVPYIVKLIAGAIFMVSGMWVSQNVHLEFIKKLQDQGVPLDPGKTIAFIGVFLILFPVIKFFFITPLADAITSRTTELEHTFSEAENLRAEMSQIRTEYEQKIQATEAEAREQIQAQIREAQELRQQLMAEAVNKADDLLKKAQQEIEQEKARVISELRIHTVDMALSAAEKLIGENMNTERNRKLVDEFIEKAEVPS